MISLSKTLKIGCGDNSCMWGSPGGMATNGGCRCVERDNAHAEHRQHVRAGVVRLRQISDGDPDVVAALIAAVESARSAALEEALGRIQDVIAANRDMPVAVAIRAVGERFFAAILALKEVDRG